MYIYSKRPGVCMPWQMSEHRSTQSDRGRSGRLYAPGGTSPTTSVLLRATQTPRRERSQREGPVSTAPARLQDCWCTTRSRAYWQQRCRRRKRAASCRESMALPICDVDSSAGHWTMRSSEPVHEQSSVGQDRKSRGEEQNRIPKPRDLGWPASRSLQALGWTSQPQLHTRSLWPTTRKAAVRSLRTWAGRQRGGARGALIGFCG